VRIAAFLLLLSCTFLPACFPPAPEAPRPAVSHPPEAIIAALNAHPNHFPAFRSLIKASLTFPEGSKTKTQSFDAVFLYRKEDQQFRLQGMDVLGRTHFDMTYKANELTIHLPPSEVTYSGDPANFPGVHGAGLFFILKKTMEGLPEGLDTTTVSFSETSGSAIIHEDQETYSLVEVNPQTLLIEKRTLVKRFQAVSEVRYWEYKRVGADFLPARIAVQLPAQKVSFQFTFDSFAPEETLPDSLFQIRPPATAQQLPLSELRMDFLF